MTIWEHQEAIDLAIALEDRGVALRVKHGKLAVSPVGKVTPGELAACRQHREALIALVLLFDDEVVNRAETFRRNPPMTLRCSDCDRPGPRCWRCSLAHRLAHPHKGNGLTVNEIFRLAAPMMTRKEEVA